MYCFCISKQLLELNFYGCRIVHLVKKKIPFIDTDHLRVNTNCVAFVSVWTIVWGKILRNAVLLKNDGDCESSSWLTMCETLSWCFMAVQSSQPFMQQPRRYRICWGLCCTDKKGCKPFKLGAWVSFWNSEWI